MPILYSVLERDVVAFLEAEAAMARMAQGRATVDQPDKLYRMGQKDGLLMAAEAVRSGILRSRLAQGTEARRAETLQDGSVHDGPVSERKCAHD